MTALLLIAAAAIGAIVRVLATDLDADFNRQLAGTAIVNIAGSFLLGLLVGSSANTMSVVGVGGLGAFTTFSTYVAQIECIHRESTTSKAALYGIGSLVAGVAAAAIGWVL